MSETKELERASRIYDAIVWSVKVKAERPVRVDMTFDRPAAIAVIVAEIRAAVQESQRPRARGSGAAR